MELISTGGYLASSTQVYAMFQTFEVASAGVSVRVLVLDESLKGLGQKPRHGSLSLYSDQLDLEQGVFGKRQSNVLSFHYYLHVE
jgi:hypothetical protein